MAAPVSVAPAGLLVPNGPMACAGPSAGYLPTIISGSMPIDQSGAQIQRWREEMGKVSFANSNNKTITMSAVINFPDGFNESRKYPAIVVSHPGGGVKEQTAGTYAKKLAARGFITIAYDASYQGESTGEPRQLENPHIRTEDVSAVVDYLTTLPYVDQDRIGAMGVCAGAGYTANAAINDPRIKAVGTVSAVNIGQMFRNGFTNEVKSADAAPLLANGANARTAKPTAAISIRCLWHR
jgi:hypothetical protein